MAAMIAREWEEAGRLFARRECARQGQQNEDIAKRRNEDDAKQPNTPLALSRLPDADLARQLTLTGLALLSESQNPNLNLRFSGSSGLEPLISRSCHEP